MSTLKDVNKFKKNVHTLFTLLNEAKAIETAPTQELLREIHDLTRLIGGNPITIPVDEADGSRCKARLLLKFLAKGKLTGDAANAWIRDT